MKLAMRSGSTLYEADVALAVSRKVRDSLRARGVDVLMTRDRDTLIALDPKFLPFYQHAVLNTGGIMTHYGAALGFALRCTHELPHDFSGWQMAAAELVTHFKWDERQPEAFDRFLRSGGPAHVPRRRLPVEEAIAMVRAAGGIAVIAHPHTLSPPGGDWEGELRRLRSLGIEGIECYYSRFAPGDVQRFLSLARTLGLLVTGGSDFHGASKPDVRLGAVDAGMPAPDALLHALLAHRRSTARRQTAETDAQGATA